MTDPNDVRRQFEAWAVDHGLPTDRESAGYYRDPDAQTAWSAVEYVHALQSPAVRELVSEATRALNWLAGYPGGGAIGCYDRLRAALRTLGAGHVE